MKLIRCNNGHFYDQDKFGTCPNCNANTADTVTEAFTPMPGVQQVPPVQQPNFQAQQEPNFAAPSEDATVGLGFEIPTVGQQNVGFVEQVVSTNNSELPKQEPEIHYNTDPEAFVSQELDRALNQSNVTIPLNQHKM